MPKGLGRPFTGQMRRMSSEAKKLGKNDPLAKKVKKSVLAASDAGLEKRKYGSVTDQFKALVTKKKK